MGATTGKLTGGQPTIVRLFHWVNIISLFGTIASGLQIYNANPVFGGREGIHIPWLITLGGWLAGGRNWQYAWHRIVYTSIIPILILAIATGLSMYQPVQFYWLASLFGDWQSLRTVHFMTVPLVLLYTLIHSTLALGIGDGKIATAFLNLKSSDRRSI